MASAEANTSENVTSTVVERGALAGLLAEFHDPHDLEHAAAKVRDAGYQKWDTHAPFPIHGIEKAMGIRTTRLPWIVLGVALCGTVTGLVLQYVCNVVFYPYWISGKPIFSLPANIPVIFELSILFGAFTALLSMLALNGLPLFYNPLFSLDRFRRSTNDKFFLMIDAKDAKFQADGTRKLIDSLHADAVEEVYEEARGVHIPRFFWFVIGIVITLSLIPPVVLARMRNIPFNVPRPHLVHDMDNQPKAKTQTLFDLFPDDRAMRPHIEGTVSRGSLDLNSEYFHGVEEGSPLLADVLRNMHKPSGLPVQSVAFQKEEKEADTEAPAEGGEAAADDAAAGPAPDPLDSIDWVKDFPEGFDVGPAMMARGQQRYNIYCSVCHGLAGDGNGLVSIRAQELMQTTWVPPLSLHADAVVDRPVGRLYHTIVHGVRKMPGYGAQIVPEDRWAIVLYIRALQRTRRGTMEDVTPAQAQELQARR